MYNTDTLMQLTVGQSPTNSDLEELSQDYNLTEYDLHGAMPGIPLTEDQIENLLFEVCDYVHSSCDIYCPVFELGGCENGECSMHKNGKKMRLFIQEKIDIKEL